jgi:activator of 2-hydroxyglutaryl-CoA dehydratase
LFEKSFDPFIKTFMAKELATGTDLDSIFLGFDIGSTSLNTVIMDDSYNILNEYYD